MPFLVFDSFVHVVLCIGALVAVLLVLVMVGLNIVEAFERDGASWGTAARAIVAPRPGLSLSELVGNIF
ncbi:hypothetical protein [Burkholderia vietnamiensis]|uniref:hypothetical protein n=1 Tax=Burkholderia vietnamiensis TaxID=60552 RepID=UPI001CF3DF59|nr:hypothetical protein [Burkholderia vietnamiensis]MCA8448938.1 hypothetical protein [Burkholderia vietnamiensis]